MSGSKEQEVFAFEGFRLDARRRLLTRDGGKPVPLTPKAFDTLHCLVEHAGNLLEKRTLLDTVWPAVVVEDNNLDQAISTLRRALGERPGENRFIVTVPGTGYRFVANVRRIETPAAPDVASAIEGRGAGSGENVGGKRPRVMLLAYGLVGALVAVGVVSVVGGYLRPARIPEKSVAVLPFLDLSESDQRWLADGLTEEITTSLGALPDLRVTARTSAFQFRNQDRDVGEIAERLGVAHIVEGSVRRDGDALRVTAQLIRARDGFHVWSEGYDRTVEIGGLLDVQRDVAEKIAIALDVLLDENRRERMFRSGTRNVEAFEANRKGWELYYAAHDGKGTLWDANDLFETAMKLDPKYAEPALGHMDAFQHQLMGDPSDGGSPYTQDEALVLFLEDLDFAIANSPDPARRLALEIYREQFSPTWWRLPELIDEFRRELNVDDFARDAPIWLVAAPVLDVVGHYDLVRELAEKSLVNDPLNNQVWFQRVLAELHSGDFVAAIELLQRARRTVGSDPRLYTAAVARAALQGERDRLVEIVSTASGNLNLAYLAAVKGDYETAGRLASEVDAQMAWPVRQLLVTYNEMASVDRTRELVRQIDALPAGSVIFVELLNTWGNALAFDLDDAPNFRARLEQAGVDPTTLKRLPRLSAGEASRPF